MRREITGTLERRHFKPDPDLLKSLVVVRVRSLFNLHSHTEPVSDNAAYFYPRRVARRLHKGGRLLTHKRNKALCFLQRHFKVEVVLLVWHERARSITTLENDICVVVAARLVPPDAQQPDNVVFLVMPCKAALAADMEVVNDSLCFRESRALGSSRILFTTFDEGFDNLVCF